MTAMSAVHPLAGGVELLERAVGFAIGGLPAVTPESLAAPTPCGAWNVQQLMDHMNDGMLALGEAFDDGEVQLDAECQQQCPLDRLQASASGLLGALATGEGRPPVSVGGCPMTAELVAAAGAVELAVHGWDLTRACGQQRPIPAALATSLLRVLPLLITEDDRPGRFGPPLPSPAGATANDRLLAWLGRTP